MKRFDLFLAFGLLVGLSAHAATTIGFVCPKSGIEIRKQQVGEIETFVVASSSRQESFEARLRLPTGAAQEAYQERVGTYYELMTEAQLLFPFMPEIARVGHMMKSTKRYKQGFRSFEGQDEPAELSELYCKSFIEALRKY